jgi:hypothetical protein
MAEVTYNSEIKGKFPPEGTIRPGEPLPRPFVTLNDGTVMTWKEWDAKGMPR